MTAVLYEFLSFMHTTCPARLILPQLIALIIVKILKSFVMHFSPPACPFSLSNTYTFSDTAASLLKLLTCYSCYKSPWNVISHYIYNWVMTFHNVEAHSQEQLCTVVSNFKEANNTTGSYKYSSGEHDNCGSGRLPPHKVHLHTTAVWNSNAQNLEK